MNATVGKVKVEAPEDRPETIMTRTFHAPRDLVFKAHSSCEHVSRWWGPRRHSFASCDMDFVEGGAWRYVLRDADGTEYPFKGEFREIQPPERLTWTFIYDVEPFNEHESVETIVFNSRWLVVPFPPEAKLSEPGFALASAISSFRFFAAVPGCTTSRFGVVAALMIGTRSFSGL